MARLILSLDGQVLAEYNMTKERYTVGRLPDNDVRIDNAAVSGHHGLIINILNDSFLEDLNSTNGIFVHGRRVRRHRLQEGDTVTLGMHQITYHRKDLPVVATGTLDAPAQQGPEADDDADDDDEENAGVEGGREG